MTDSILITQCLQNDFVMPLRRHQPLPNRLHVGYEEARRLMGDRPDEGPVARLMQWAQSADDDALQVIHIRDWHDAQDAQQRAHLERFGPHCLADSEGAAFAFPTDAAARASAVIVDSITLNDFLGTSLDAALAPYRDRPARVGLAGVWTEAKVTFLAYELRTRYPRLQLGVCSALTASSSRAQHFIALDQLQRLLGVEVFYSLGAFIEFLGGRGDDLPLFRWDERYPELRVDGDARIGDDDDQLLRHFFRDCRTAELSVLDGGFSGNLVLGTQSTDMHGHAQVAHVVKVGPVDSIAQERISFERIESVLGNSAPRITEFAERGGRGALKYRYASMGGGFSTTFQRRYLDGLDDDGVDAVLDTVFGEQLQRLYDAAQRESCDLLDYYAFDPRWADSVLGKVRDLVGERAQDERLSIAGRDVANPWQLYAHHLDALPDNSGDTVWFSYVHGDLNGANIIIDAQDNVWLIDFFHTHRGHVLKDLIKLENDLLYIFTPLPDDETLEEALRISDALLAVEDLAAEPPDADDIGLTTPALRRAWRTLRKLRSFYAALIDTDRDPEQSWIGMLRYAVHTLSFDESSRRQRLWALYTAGRASERIVKRRTGSKKLRVDWLDDELCSPGRVGLTLLPGRRDYKRVLEEDLTVLRAEGVTHVACFVPQWELERYGVGELLSAYDDAGLSTHHLPVMDQSVPTAEEMNRFNAWLEAAVQAGGRVLLHCVGGLGRSGTAAACWLRSRGHDAERSIGAVREARTARAIESERQVRFVRELQRR
jgi:protein-tyrosine phosphatase/nicotinamidase-related amidase